MRIQPTLQPPTMAREAVPDAGTRLRVGSVVAATTRFDAAAGEFRLLLDGQWWRFKPASPQLGRLLAANQRLSLRVASGGAEPVLELLRDDGPNAVRLGALRRYAPQQSHPGTLLANIASLLDGAEPAAPAPWRPALERYRESLPRLQALTTPDGVQRALQRAGSNLERSLATGNPLADPADVGTDLKAALLALRAALAALPRQPPPQPPLDLAPPVSLREQPLRSLRLPPPTLLPTDPAEQQSHQLHRQTEGTLARLVTTQLAHADPASAALGWLVEIPLRFDDGLALLRLKVRRAAAGDGADDWEIELALDAGRHGDVQAIIVSRAGVITLCVSSSREALTSLLERHAGELRDRLRAAGLDVERVTCRLAPRRDEPFDDIATATLLDVSA